MTDDIEREAQTNNPNSQELTPAVLEAPFPQQGNQPKEDIRQLAKDVHWTTHATFWSQVGLGLIGVVALWIYHGQLTAMQGQLDQMGRQSAEMQKQTTVLRQQMVGTQAAALETVLTFVPSGELTINVINNGLVSATGVHIHGQAQRLRSADGVRIGDSFPLDETFPIIAAKGRPSPSWFLPWHPREFIYERGWPVGWPGRETFSFEGEITYQNGFGDGIRDTFCQKWLPRYTIQFKSGGLQISNGGALVPCRNFDRTVRMILEAEKQAENGADRPDRPF